MCLMIAFILVGDLLALESRQAAQLQIENRLRLYLRKRKPLHRLLAASSRSCSGSSAGAPFQVFTSLIVFRLPVSHCRASSTERELRISVTM